MAAAQRGKLTSRRKCEKREGGRRDPVQEIWRLRQKRKRGLQAWRGEGELEFAAVREGVRGGESAGGRERPEKENQTLTPAVWSVGRDLHFKDTEKGRWMVEKRRAGTPAGRAPAQPHRPQRRCPLPDAPARRPAAPGAPPPSPARPAPGAGMKLAAAVMSPHRAEEAESPPGSPARLV